MAIDAERRRIPALEKDKEIEEYISEEQLQQRVEELAEQISHDYNGKQLTLIGVLKGGAFFLADLTRALGRRAFYVKLGFIGRASYGSGTETSGEAKPTFTLDTNIEDKDTLLVEDIADTGTTLVDVQNDLRSRNPRSLRTCVLLNKPSRRQVPVDLDYIGFDIPNKFVVGDGLDKDEDYRGLPFIGVVVDKQPILASTS